MKLTYHEPKVPHLAPVPRTDAHNQVICLDGEWEICYGVGRVVPIKEQIITGGGEMDSLWQADAEQEDAVEEVHHFEPVRVPDSVRVYERGKITHKGCYTYRKTLSLPPRSKDARVLLRFEGVNGYCRLMIDGEFVRDHFNAQITWDADITALTAGKDEVELTLAVDEAVDHVSTFSHGGILHSVYLLILPSNYISMLHTTTALCSEVKPSGIDGRTSSVANMTLRIDWACFLADPSYYIKVNLIAPDGTSSPFALLTLPEGTDTGSRTHIVADTLLWDSEHPNLYTLEAILYSSHHTEIECIHHRFGFREINRKGNQLFVNNQEVKLRGSCRHEITPLHGRAVPKELIEEDVRLFKAANHNYIRTSHYPPSAYFLDLCDEYGIYVEDELALAFIARTLEYTNQDPAQTERYLSHFTETMARDYSHPSVIMWSLCNESFGGYNFDLLNQLAHKLDPTRPTKFSYPMTMREEHEPIDIWSIHYSNLDTDLAAKKDNVSVGGAPGYDVPVIHDEFVHVPCYNRTEKRRDPNVQNFWGESIHKFWDKIWNTKGALGGAIWASIDETDIYRGGDTVLAWGIIDVWRREKPEHYVTRKAYSPISVKEREYRYKDGALISVENRFCHTNFSEVNVRYSGGDSNGTITLPPALPHEIAALCIPLAPADQAKPLFLWFSDASGTVVDEYCLLPKGSCSARKDLARKQMIFDSNKQLHVTWQESQIVITGDRVRYIFDTETGLLTEGSADNQRILVGGPYLNAPYLRLGKWRKNAFTVKDVTHGVDVIIDGSYEKTMDVTFTITLCADGRFKTAYRINKLYAAMPKAVKLRVGVDCGGLDEIGVAYLADGAFDTLSWEREGEWSIYPDTHIARNKGIAYRRSASYGGHMVNGSAATVFGEKPQIAWGQEERADLLHGYYDVSDKGTADFRSTKEHLYCATLYTENDDERPNGLTLYSDANIGIRLEIADNEADIIDDRSDRIRYTGNWYAMEDYSGASNNTEMWAKESGSAAECSFTGTGIAWYGPQDVHYGLAAVYIDGKLMDGAVNQRVCGVDFPGSAAGYDKKYHFPIYSITGLAPGEHTIRIEATGRRKDDSADCYIVIDHLRILETTPAPVRVLCNHATNYPNIAWGNYCRKAIVIEDGYENEVYMKI